MSAAPRYAAALLSLTQDAEVEQVGEGLRRVLELWQQTPTLRGLVRHPSVSRERRRLVVRMLAKQAGASPVLERTLLLLADRGRLAELPEVALHFEQLADNTAGRLRAEVSSASELPEAYFSELRRALEAVSGKSVRLVRRVEPQLIGGVVTRLSGRRWDGSLRGHLQALREGFAS